MRRIEAADNLIRLSACAIEVEANNFDIRSAPNRPLCGFCSNDDRVFEKAVNEPTGARIKVEMGVGLFTHYALFLSGARTDNRPACLKCLG